MNKPTIMKTMTGEKKREKKYLMIYRETAFGEEQEKAEEFTLEGLRLLFKYCSDSVVKIHLIKEL